MCENNEMNAAAGQNPIKVTVVIPIYNALEYLRIMLDSIVSQTLRDIEIICIDDGSTDRSIDVLKEYRDRDSRIRLVTETNAGPSIARNNGIKRARGEYISFFDADDFCEPTFLEKLYEAAVRDNLDIVISKYDIYNEKRSKFEPAIDDEGAWIYEEGKVTSKSEYPDVILDSTIGSAWNKLFKTSYIRDAGLLFPSDVRVYEDVYFVATAMSLAERVGKIFEVLVHHRIHSEQSRDKFFKKYYSKIPEVYGKIKEFLVQHGMYAPLSVSFLNLSAGRISKIIDRLAIDEREKLWNMLHFEYSESLGWQNREASDFHSRDVCAFVANVDMYDYTAYKSRELKGKCVNAKRVEKHLKGAKARRFFASIFRRKKKSGK